MANKKSLNSAFKKAKVASERPDYKSKPISAEARSKGKETMKKVGKYAGDVAKRVLVETGTERIVKAVSDKAKSKKSMSSKPLTYTATHRTTKPIKKTGR